ncbi:MAG: XdhC family protein [Anaerolineales bacterium]|nr:XdhC family protein [Anaerolineales bacterium]
MQEVVTDINRWRSEDQPVALATVIQTWGSAPRKAGAKMAVTPEGQLSGSVSGGCVEGAVYEEAVAALENHKPKLLSYGVADETAWEVGLACGGSIQIFVEGLHNEIYEAIDHLLAEERAGAVATVIAGDEALLGAKLFIDTQGKRLGGITAALDEPIVKQMKTAIKQGKVQRVTLPDSDLELFIDVFLPPPQLVMVGGVHIAVALAALAKTLGYRTIVVDPRRAFGSDERFPHADALIQKWPEKAFAEITINENTAVALLTHDPKIDDPALGVVLNSPAFYVGALGSSKTHAKRVVRLQEAGFDEQTIGRIYGPIGLDIGAQNPEEIALSVLGEIVKARHSG